MFAHPLFCISIVFHFSQGHCNNNYPGEIKNKGYATFWEAIRVYNYGTCMNCKWEVLELTGTLGCIFAVLKLLVCS